MTAITLDLGEEMVERIARRAAELLAERESASDGGYLDVAGAALFLACPKSRIYALVSAGRLPHHHDGSRLLFDPVELREYVRRGGAKRP